jgi:aryl-alcohol dehydrogenase-like predicted oxidoreductase
MDYQLLGNTGVFVSRICLGAMTFGGSGPGMLEAQGSDRRPGEVRDWSKYTK